MNKTDKIEPSFNPPSEASLKDLELELEAAANEKAKSAKLARKKQGRKEKQKRADRLGKLFDELDEEEFAPRDFVLPVDVDSLEARVGYSSLIRQMNEAICHQIEFYQTPAGNSHSLEEARKIVFRKCDDPEKAKAQFKYLTQSSMEHFTFYGLSKLWDVAPRVAERLWENVKLHARKEFESGHAAANKMFPGPSYMKGAWEVAKYIGLRESFIREWKPKGGIEVSLIDMLAQSYFQWQYWMEQSVLRSQTEPRREHHEYRAWKAQNERAKNAKSWEDGHWFPPYVEEQEALENAVQMVDRWNRIYMRTLRQLRDLRRYSPVKISNPKQVNIATEGGKQANIVE